VLVLVLDPELLRSEDEDEDENEDDFDGPNNHLPQLPSFQPARFPFYYPAL